MQNEIINLPNRIKYFLPNTDCITILYDDYSECGKYRSVLCKTFVRSGGKISFTGKDGKKYSQTIIVKKP